MKSDLQTQECDCEGGSGGGGKGREGGKKERKEGNRQFVIDSMIIA